MRKVTATILSLLTLTTATAVAGIFAQKTPVHAQAETPRGEQLITPSSYEEYLSLSSPSDVATTDGFVAIADGNTLFLFDKQREIWQNYTHSAPITKIHFSTRNQLYFLDKTNSLYFFDVGASSLPTKTDLFCSTFSIHGNTLYYVNISAELTSILCAAPLSNLADRTELYTADLITPAISCWNAEIYFADTMGHLYKFNLTNTTPIEVANIPLGVISMTISEGVLCCATKTGAFYAYNLTELIEKGNTKDCEPLADFLDAYTDVSANGNEIYLVNGNTIEQFSLAEKAFLDYTIGATSSSKNRFNGASALTLTSDKLFIADDNNNRISVYDTKANAFQDSIFCELDSPFLSSYADTLLVSTSTQAILYSLSEKTYGQTVFTLTPDKISGNVIGATTIYGAYYLVTDTNYCYTLMDNGEGYQCTEILRNTHFAEKITSDVNGFIYLLNNGAIYRYTEESFLAPTEEGIKICEDLPHDTTKIAVDYGNNLYALSGNTLYCYSPQAEDVYNLESTTFFDKPLVYNTTNEVVSFALGIEENATYILYKGNYLTVSDELCLPTVKSIPTDDVAEEIFKATIAEFAVVQTQPNTFLIEVDASKLQDGATFAYLSSYRSTQPITALKVAETDNYALLLYREGSSIRYKTLLVDLRLQAELSDGYRILYETPQTAYLTNLSKAYKFPSMGLPSIGELAKNTQVTILGEVNGLDCEYYAIAYNEQTAYIPKSHFVFFDGTPPTEEEITLGDAQGKTGEMWRLTYLLLGSVAICILVDTLILRKKDSDE